MPSEATSEAWEHAALVSGDKSVLEGPLKGYHHETYVFPLPGEAGMAGGARWKCKEPRKELLWFDRRCFTSEEELLRDLWGQITHIPEVIDAGVTGLQRFIEGKTLGYHFGSGDVIPEAIIDQVVDLFRELVRVVPDKLDAERRCKPEDRPADGDTSGFLERLIHFTEQHVYQRNMKSFGGLFSSLHIGSGVFEKLRAPVSNMVKRPFSLLHGDLHRENFVLDEREQLWTIDWELAMVGDPLYDLATHLYLMTYQADQQAEVARRWCEAVEDVRPGSSKGWEKDLPILLDFKRSQSVFTDVIRGALALAEASGPASRLLSDVGGKVHGVLHRASGPLGLEDVPTRQAVTEALALWSGVARGERVS